MMMIFVVPMDDVPNFLNDYFANVGTRLNSMNGVILEDLDGIYGYMNGHESTLPTIDRYNILFLEKNIDIHKNSCTRIPEIRSDICKYLFEKKRVKYFASKC